jgi:hypothetical protein
MQDPDRYSIASDPFPWADETLLAGRASSPVPTEQFILSGDPLDLAPKTQAKGKAKALYKRQISEAIPRAEREVERAPVAATGTRKSARTRKPNSRN